MKLFLLVLLFCIIIYRIDAQYFVGDQYEFSTCTGTIFATYYYNVKAQCIADSNGQDSA